MGITSWAQIRFGCSHDQCGRCRSPKGTRRIFASGVVALVEDGDSAREAARLLNIGAATAIRWIDRWTTAGSVEAKVVKLRVEMKMRRRSVQMFQIYKKSRKTGCQTCIMRRLDCDRFPLLEKPEVAATVFDFGSSWPQGGVRRRPRSRWVSGSNPEVAGCRRHGDQR